MNDATSPHCGTACGAEPGAVASLNNDCYCVTLPSGALREALAHEPDAGAILPLLEARCPYVFSAQPVFLSHGQAERMEAVIAAVEFVAALPAWREKTLADAPAIARMDPGGASGVFFGYDFHVEGDNVGLIEVNTNAGGAMLNALLARAQRACCGVIDDLIHTPAVAEAFENAICAMFEREWTKSGRTGPLRTIAIVDQAPGEQYLYPEFLLFQRLFARRGWQAVIADPAQLTWRDGRLHHGAIAIDLVYNRLTDFMLEQPSSAALRAAYEAHAVVLTPHPQAHAVYADKRNLALLSDADALAGLGVPAAVKATLLGNVPHTERVDPERADALWAGRRQLFFKPAAGFGSRAAYRGDKLTRRVWDEILQGGYIAQALVPPGQRGTAGDPLKFDIRVYCYEGRTLWTAARLYQGQTTNFRTPGGGFAPVYRLP